MHSHTSTGITLASDIINKMIELDSMLAYTDTDDKAELAERLSDLPANEVMHILELLIERGLIHKTAEQPSEEAR
ncbi:MAG: hypothetical protein JSR20_14745 [Nitrospira sp.]|nr:hypothetical protein [Nitrospira sp.]